MVFKSEDFYIGRIVLRIAGRKSISQMTITQVVIMIGIGSLLIQPLAGKGLTRTFAVAFLITLLMVLTEYIEMKFDFKNKGILESNHGGSVWYNIILEFN